MKKTITKRQIKSTFKAHDMDDTGALNAKCLYKALVSLKLPVELSDMDDLFESVGREKEASVELDDFIDIVLELKGDTDSDVANDFEEEEEDDEEEEEPTADIAFQMLADPAVNGITLQSLLKVCETQDESWTKQQIMEMMNEADLNHDGLIDPNEFKIVCKKAGL
ncbi:uncharacterized protein ATC70_008703 [Mucor velutinosus]|uniref:EF-hand domain-containing protein n=1 Tax=Mucor velutinosus TaxID=708070 RepID=A0AAN7DM49_9FUNG|nr:hypothetical protein ATC70_008703 [Mucor velutinosus]